MSGIFFGLFKCVGKAHTVNKSDEQKFKLKFEDDLDNKLTIVVDESTFNDFNVGDPLLWKMVRRQGTLTEPET